MRGVRSAGTILGPISRIIAYFTFGSRHHMRVHEAQELSAVKGDGPHMSGADGVGMIRLGSTVPHDALDECKCLAAQTENGQCGHASTVWTHQSL
jgi:hypothetical protein